MAVVLPGKFIYLATMHTASMATASALKKLPGAFQPKSPFDGVGHHSTLEEVKKFCGSRLTGSEVVFTAVRNPYDIVVSWFLRNRYHFLIPARASMAEFLGIWASSQRTPFFRDGRMLYLAKDCRVVLRYEKGIEAQVNEVLRRISGVPPVQILRENETPEKEHWSLHHTKETYAIVNRLFQEDIVQFGYPFIWDQG